MGESRGVCRILVRIPEEKRPRGRPRCKWEDNIKMGRQEIGCGIMGLIDPAQDRDKWRVLVIVVINFRVT